MRAIIELSPSQELFPKPEVLIPSQEEHRQSGILNQDCQNVRDHHPSQTGGF